VSKFSEWLEEQIRELGIGNNQLAGYAGLSPSAISKLRLGQRQPSPETLKKLAKYFRVEYDFLLGLAGIRDEEGEPAGPEVIEDPELRVWLNVENINGLSEAGKAAILAVIKAEKVSRERAQGSKSKDKGGSKAGRKD
jgi:transcriptional regulator with XRE-family HTH domain